MKGYPIDLVMVHGINCWNGSEFITVFNAILTSRQTCEKSGNLVGNSLVGTCLTLPNLGSLWVFFKYPKISVIFSCEYNPLFCSFSLQVTFFAEQLFYGNYWTLISDINTVRPSSFFSPFNIVRPTQIFGIFKKKSYDVVKPFLTWNSSFNLKNEHSNSIEKNRNRTRNQNRNIFYSILCILKIQICECSLLMSSWGTRAFHSKTSCVFFRCFFSIQPTHPTSGNTFDAKWKKKKGWPNFSHIYLLVKMVSKTMTRSIAGSYTHYYRPS